MFIKGSQLATSGNDFEDERQHDGGPLFQQKPLCRPTTLVSTGDHFESANRHAA
jgi:hypothetical protein